MNGKDRIAVLTEIPADNPLRLLIKDCDIKESKLDDTELRKREKTNELAKALDVLKRDVAKTRTRR